MSAENAAEVNGGAEVSIKSKILDNPSFKELSQEEIDAEIAGISRLILDETSICQISDEDKEFLAKFVDMKRFSLAQTKLKKLNLPEKWNLESIQLSDNAIDDEGIEYLTKYSDSLRTLRIANNKIKSIDSMVSFIGKMKHLQFLDLSNNAICKEENYRDKIMAALKKNTNDEEDGIVLDCKNEEGLSVSDNSDDDMEEGEFDMDGMEGGEDDIYNELEISSELRAKIKNGTVTEEELQGLQLNAGLMSDYGEEGEEEADECCAHDHAHEPAAKKPKTE